MHTSFRSIVVLLLLVLRVSAKEGEAVAQGSTCAIPMVSLLSPASRDSSLSLTAIQNNQLRGKLAWNFGGKTQKGWGVYMPLIRKLISDTGPENPSSFAGRLAQWQRSKNLTPTGVLNEETWSAMIAAWQGPRMTHKLTPAPADKLIVRPSSDFFDASRVDGLRKVDDEAYRAYKKMIAAAIKDPSSGIRGNGAELAADEKYFRIVSAYRPQEYQDQLRKNCPNSGSAGLAKRSPHLTGKALDLYVGGQPVSTADANREVQVRTAAYQWLVQNADQFGFRPYFYEPWHWEYAGSQSL